MGRFWPHYEVTHQWVESGVLGWSRLKLQSITFFVAGHSFLQDFTAFIKHLTEDSRVFRFLAPSPIIGHNGIRSYSPMGGDCLWGKRARVQGGRKDGCRPANNTRPPDIPGQRPPTSSQGLP